MQAGRSAHDTHRRLLGGCREVFLSVVHAASRAKAGYCLSLRLPVIASVASRKIEIAERPEETRASCGRHLRHGDRQKPSSFRKHSLE
jgi:hypothetical protein